MISVPQDRQMSLFYTVELPCGYVPVPVPVPVQYKGYRKHHLYFTQYGSTSSRLPVLALYNDVKIQNVFQGRYEYWYVVQYSYWLVQERDTDRDLLFGCGAAAVQNPYFIPVFHSSTVLAL